MSTTTAHLPSHNQTLVVDMNRSGNTSRVAPAFSSEYWEDPPGYDDVVTPEAPPPPYESLFGRVREVHKASNGTLDFVKNVVTLLLGTLGCTIILGITIVIPLCMLAFGMMFMRQCPKSEYIPVFLMVGGGLGIIKQLLHLSTRVRSRVEDQELERLRQYPTQTMINCFLLGWFVIGSFWVYGIYEPSYDPASKNGYCNKTLYLFSFWLLSSIYIALGVVTFILVGVAILGTVIGFFSLWHNADESA
ncbi:transmembrane protein 272-like [Sabethes cyaneus]|uniref:transmembrane protein 272-like n=1 Tax=Sabethes cyaneus TaxID=53552 RepID=UPI00237DA85A|nr:transmembrane protein 272-like [Sabethes cyaneus]